MILLLFSAAWCNAQKKDLLYSAENDTLAVLEEELPEPDIKYFPLGNIQEVKTFSDTLFDDFEKYNPAYTFEQAGLTLGNTGSAQYQVAFKPREDINTVAGFEQYDIYKTRLDEFRYYRLNRPFNELFFSPVGGRQNFVVGAKFSRDFENDINLSIDYKRFRQSGFYNNQLTKSTAFGVGIWKSFPKKDHHIFFTFLANNHNEEINGGVATDTLFDKELFRLRTAIPVRLESDTTRHQHFSYSVDNYFNKVAGFLRVHHRLRYESGYFRFGDHDTDTVEDSLVYRSFLNENRGIRYYLGFNRISNTLDLSFSNGPIHLLTGLRYGYQRYDNSLEIRNIHDLTVFGDVGLHFKEFSKITGHAGLGIGSNAGSLEFGAAIDLSAIESLYLKGLLEFRRYDPSLLQQEAVVNGAYIYRNDFSKTNVLTIGGDLEWDFLDTRITLRSGIMDNTIAFDSEALPYQADNSIEYFQLRFSHTLRFSFLGLENQILYQKFSENLFNLPTVYSIHNLFVQTPMFSGRLLTRMGLLYYNIDYDGAVAFMPVTGVFYPVDTAIDRYPYTELYANFKIDQFRLFFKIDNFTELITREVHYQVVDYPQFDYKLRLGVRWILYD